jgi:glycosyltransferase involved in cell wall biosynthesis
VDILMKAYQSAFTNQDDVSLIIKDIGSSSFYRHMTVIPWLLKESKKPENPRMIVLLEEMDETKLSELYRGCDALVLPYRGEGFGMPLLEAMACGKPVITTGEGPAREFCPEDCSYFIPAKQAAIPGGIPGFGELAGEPTWFEPDPKELAAAMRDVFENQAEAAIRGNRAGEVIRPAYNWKRVTEMYIERIASLTGQEITLAAPALHSAD